MANAISCDQCGKKIVLDNEEAQAKADGWYFVGFRGTELLDACSRVCAMDLLIEGGEFHQAEQRAAAAQEGR